MPENNLKDRVAIVTGSGRGIGRAICLELAQKGCRVVAADILEKNALRVAEEIIAGGGEAMATGTNVSLNEQVQKMVNKAVARFGKLDILVNNAGITRDALLEKMTEEEWDTVINVNLKGAFLCIQAAATEMRRNRYGRIINFSSKGGAAGNVGQINYCASKTGIIGLTRAVAKEFGRYAAKEGADMTCNAILPGFIDTPMSEKIPEEIKKAFLNEIPLKRSGAPREIAKVVSFLASPGAGYLTGTTIGVDGGFFMGVGC
ncbi:MAG TPA: beta-ketoacyl-ACP reductase [Firmicutes bacterium]|nr:beta-ketoacyl-ACP reductase [Bacillota bacterium]